MNGKLVEYYGLNGCYYGEVCRVTFCPDGKVNLISQTTGAVAQILYSVPAFYALMRDGTYRPVR